MSSVSFRPVFVESHPAVLSDEEVGRVRYAFEIGNEKPAWSASQWFKGRAKQSERKALEDTIDFEFSGSFFVEIVVFSFCLHSFTEFLAAFGDVYSVHNK